MTTLQFKMASNGFSWLYRINCKGPWRSEYKTDSLLENGEYPIIDATSGKIVGKWIQQTLGHILNAV